MPVYLDKRTKRFFIQFQFRQQTYKERLPDKTTRKQAEMIEVKMRNDVMLESHGIVSRQKDITFDRFLKEYFAPYAEAKYSKGSYEYAVTVCKAALELFRGRPLRGIKPADIERFKNIRASLVTQHDRPRKPATVAREMSIISKLFSIAVQNDLCDYNPYTRVEKPKFDNVQDTILRLEDEEAFFAAFKSEWCRDICKVALYTGLRQNDILNLTRFNVDLDAGVIRLVQGKTQRRIEVIILDTIRPMLEWRCRRASSSPLVFPSPKTGKAGTQTKTAIRNACIRAKIPVITIRDLRRSCATRLEDLGFSSGTIAKYLGHSDLRSVHRYQRSRDAMREAAKALENQVKPAISLPDIRTAKRK